MSGCELVEVRNVADAVGLVLSKRSDTMRRQARKRYLQVVERNGGPGRDRTDDLFHAMEARSQLRHRPTWPSCGSKSGKPMEVPSGKHNRTSNPLSATCNPRCLRLLVSCEILPRTLLLHSSSIATSTRYMTSLIRSSNRRELSARRMNFNL